MSRKRLIGIGLAIYVLALIATAPATLIDGRLMRASTGAMRLAEAEGTLWSGTGLLEMLDASRSSGIAKRIAWHIRPAYLLRGKLRYEITLDGASQHFPVTISRSRIELTEADIRLPAAALGLGEPQLAPLGLTGDVLLHIARLSLGQGLVQGNATLQWHGAGSAFTQVSPLGDYELRFEGDGAAIKAALRTLRGPLQLDGNGSWSSDSNPAFSATARFPPQYRTQLAPLFRMISVERGDGSFTLQLQ